MIFIPMSIIGFKFTSQCMHPMLNLCIYRLLNGAIPPANEANKKAEAAIHATSTSEPILILF